MFGLSLNSGAKKKEQIRFLEQQLHQRGKDNAVIAERLREVEARNKEVEISHNKISDDRTSLSRRLGEVEKELRTAKEKIEQFKGLMSQYEQAVSKFTEAAGTFDADVAMIDTSFIDDGKVPEHLQDTERALYDAVQAEKTARRFDATEDRPAHGYGDD